MEKENTVSGKEDKSAAAKQRIDSHHSQFADVEKTAQTPTHGNTKSCPPPSTPRARLPLAELVGNVDDSSRHVIKTAVSPEEQLCWRGSQQINTPLPRKRKRARSSSPAAPSPEEESHAQAHDTRQLTTPQANPATDLWNQYTNNKGTPSGHKGIAFAHLISEASPRSSATAGSVSGLRRWASCGVEFPASTRKRRRTQAPVSIFRDQAEDITDQPSSDGNLQGPPRGKTNLVELLEKIRESKAKPVTSETLAPSSSSPLPASERQHDPNDSPLRSRGRGDMEDDETSENMGDNSAVAEEEEEEEERNDCKPRKTSDSFDEFGCADFDDEMEDTIEFSRTRASPRDQLIQPTDTTDSLAARRVPSEPPAVNAADSDDEFGLDEDIFAEDLELVASLYDTRAERSPEVQAPVSAGTGDAQPTNTASVAPSVIDLVEDDDEDDFGDDIDVDEFAAAEVAATQAPAPSVCRSQTR